MSIYRENALPPSVVPTRWQRFVDWARKEKGTLILSSSLIAVYTYLLVIGFFVAQKAIESKVARDLCIKVTNCTSAVIDENMKVCRCPGNWIIVGRPSK